MLTPRIGRFVVPRNHRPGHGWYHHVSVVVEGHHVDALTGAAGDPSETYLERHFLYPAAILQDVVDLAREDL